MLDRPENLQKSTENLREGAINSYISDIQLIFEISPSEILFYIFLNSYIILVNIHLNTLDQYENINIYIVPISYNI